MLACCDGIAWKVDEQYKDSPEQHLSSVQWQAGSSQRKELLIFLTKYVHCTRTDGFTRLSYIEIGRAKHKTKPTIDKYFITIKLDYMLIIETE